MGCSRSLGGRIWRGARVLLCSLLVLALLGVLILLGINWHVKNRAESYFLTQEQAAESSSDYILVLGASVLRGGTLSNILQHRVDRAIWLYEAGAAPCILMSGDSAVPSNYDEVTYMRRYALQSGVPADAVALDAYGVSTFDSMQNLAKQEPGAKVIIVTQRYHLYRAVYIAREIGLEAYGVAAEDVSYQQEKRDQREFFARIKDFCLVLSTKI